MFANDSRPFRDMPGIDGSTQIEFGDCAGGSPPFRCRVSIEIQIATRSVRFPMNRAQQCDIAEITETHRAITRGMMPGRSHQTKRGFATQCCARRVNRSASRLSRVHFDVGITAYRDRNHPAHCDAFDMLMRSARNNSSSVAARRFAAIFHSAAPVL